MLRELEPLVSQYARSRQVLFDALEGLTAEQLDVCLPDREWSIKDTLVHLDTNERLMTALLADIAHGTRSALPDTFDNEKFNRQEVEKGRTKSVEQVQADLDASYAALIDILEQVTSEGLNRRGIHPAAGDTTVKEFFLAMYAHHEVHCRDVVEQARRLKRGEGS